MPMWLRLSGWLVLGAALLALAGWSQGVPTGAPALTITAPAPGATVSGVSVQAIATCATSCSQVQFQIDGANIGQPVPGSSPYSTAFNSISLINGTHIITAIGTNATASNSNYLNFTVNNLPLPTVAITAPDGGTPPIAVSATINPTATCTPSCSQMQFQIDGNDIGTPITGSSPYSTTFDTTTISNGSGHTLNAIGSNTTGSTTTSVALTVNNLAAPTVAITAPDGGTPPIAVSGIINPITATCTASCNQVQFQMDGNNIGAPVTGSSPYSTTFNTDSLKNGPHTIAAIGSNAAGNGTASLAITVNNPAYTGAGDINPTYTAFYGTRAYSAVTRGNPVLRACVSGQCADLFSSVSNGDLVPAAIGTTGITCPGGSGCSIQTLYDLAHNSVAAPSAGNPITQATSSRQPTFQPNAFGSGHYCLSFNGGQLLAGPTPTWSTGASTQTFVAERTGNITQYNAVLRSDSSNSLNLGFNNTANTLEAYAGTLVTVTATDNAPHVVQALFAAAGTGSNIMVDGATPVGVNPGTLLWSANIEVGGDLSQSQYMTGVVCEVGYYASDVSSNNATLTSNQLAWWNVPPAPPPSGGTYQGAGDIASYSHWYGSRAYSSATVGQPLYNVCVSNLSTNTDAGCADLFSDSSTGDLKSATIGVTGVTCPSPRTTYINAGISTSACTIKTAYDLRNNSVSNPSAGAPVTQATIANRPYLIAGTLPILGSTRACMYFNDPGAALASTATNLWPALPLTMSWVGVNQGAGSRYGYNPNNQQQYSSYSNLAFGASGGFPNLVFAAPYQWGSTTPGNNINVQAGSFISAGEEDHAPHAVQAVVNGASSSISVDGGTAVTGNAGTTVAAAGVTLGAVYVPNSVLFEGIICEAGFGAGSPSTAIQNALSTNQKNYFMTAQTVVTPIFNMTWDFDSGSAASVTTGTQISIPVMGQVFAGSGVTGYDNQNYVHSSNNTPCEVTSGSVATSGCVPAPKALWIVNGHGNPGRAMQAILSQGTYSQNEHVNGQGAPFGNIFLQTPYNVIDWQYDENLGLTPNVSANFDLTSLAKVGIPSGFVDYNTNAAQGFENLYYCIGGTAVNEVCPNPATSFDMSPDLADVGWQVNSSAGCHFGLGAVPPLCAIGTVSPSMVTGIRGGHGPRLDAGTYYHYHSIIAQGPYGFMRSYVTIGGIETEYLTISRANPFSCLGAGNGAAIPASSNFPSGSTTNCPASSGGVSVGLQFFMHFGGGAQDAAKNDSSFLWDNINAKAYNR